MKRVLAATGALGLALALSACASEDSETTTSMTETDTTTEVTTSETTTSETTTEETATETTTTMAGEGEDIVDTAVAAGQFTTLTTALQEAGLVETLKGDGPFTVFAPTDEAFAALPEGTLDTLLADPSGDLTEILTYHVIPDEVFAADVVELDGQTVDTVQGGSLTVNVDGENVSLTDEAGNTVNVIDTDIEASNGVIHVIDGVLMPTL
ncbi:fasciclin domain-containing protein [Corynebacterium guangdongense]|uniref:Surface protein with fasciclin (FAS1) repeats n=1 Tax=Corynebacterium guangdongense TaxID=1783348 RepID=A0ABU1ZUP2_9CORY|nr:fasciclin domain-containing protein [Corynebacterium guangdongense]MDR7328650.1 putative surface protein with fasciclin (FAS1) repeats [Corynebacterium guangdongense]WJZ17227.1 Immunogenic protein MPT70 precursor [Corynebacterium guangdongense]